MTEAGDAVDVERLFDEAALTLTAEDADVAPGRALGRVGLMVGGKLFGFPVRGRLVVKLPEDRVDELVAAGATRFDANKGTPMREWVCVDPPDVPACLALLREARVFVGSIAAPPARGRRASRRPGVG